MIGGEVRVNLEAVRTRGCHRHQVSGRELVPNIGSGHPLAEAEAAARRELFVEEDHELTWRGGLDGHGKTGEARRSFQCPRGSPSRGHIDVDRLKRHDGNARPAVFDLEVLGFQSGHGLAGLVRHVDRHGDEGHAGLEDRRLLLLLGGLGRPNDRSSRPGQNERNSEPRPAAKAHSPDAISARQSRFRCWRFDPSRDRGTAGGGCRRLEPRVAQPR